ncbi:hypothetical protein GmRootA79_24580 [Acidovorax sp. A79]
MVAVFLAIAPLHQFGMARRLAPVALDALAGLAQRHGFEFVLSRQVFGHGGAALGAVVSGWDCMLRGGYCKPPAHARAKHGARTTPRHRLGSAPAPDGPAQQAIKTRA